MHSYVTAKAKIRLAPIGIAILLERWSCVRLLLDEDVLNVMYNRNLAAIRSVDAAAPPKASFSFSQGTQSIFDLRASAQPPTTSASDQKSSSDSITAPQSQHQSFFSADASSNSKTSSLLQLPTTTISSFSSNSAMTQSTEGIPMLLDSALPKQQSQQQSTSVLSSLSKDEQEPYRFPVFEPHEIRNALSAVLVVSPILFLMDCDLQRDEDTKFGVVPTDSNERVQLVELMLQRGIDPNVGDLWRHQGNRVTKTNE